MLETFEALLKDEDFTKIGEQSPEKRQKYLTSLIGGRFAAKYGQMDAPDLETQLKLKELVSQRISGRFKDNVDGMMAELREISKDATTNPNEKVKMPSLFDVQGGDALDDLNESL